MDFFPVSPGPFLPDITIDKKSKDDLSLDLDLESFPDVIFEKQEKLSEPSKDALFDHAQGNDFSMFDNLDSFLQEFGNSVSEEGLLSPSPLSDSGLSNTDTGSDQMMSPAGNDDDLSGTDTSEPERAISPLDLIKVEPPSPDSTTERVATVCTSVGERTAVPAAARPVTTSAPTVTVLRQARPGQSILIPVNIKGSGNIKTVKILSAPGNLKSPTIVGELRPTAVRHGGTTRMVYSIAGGERLQTSAGPVITVCSSRAGADTAAAAAGLPDGQKKKLDLSPEERRLLKKEGVLLPTHYPLTREEERELKRIRRKIRNKMSAQDSRKRKKEYIDGLEDRVRMCTAENQDLHKRIKRLESQNGQLSAQNTSLTTHNETLSSQLRRLQAHITRVALGAGRGVAQPSTCLMILLLSLSLCVLPSLKEEAADESALSKADAGARSARTLLSQSTKADFLSLYLGRKPAVSQLAGLDLELSDIEDEAPVARRAAQPPPRKRARLAGRWQDELQAAPLDDGPPPEPDPSSPGTRNGTRPPARLVLTVERQ
ncbi:cyclic AMP-responsive element-binding protein 3-like protein 3 [Pollicipes pollicipes]|uniref:cyclic AMP-responsive element-binding protein 3-like protein 3 n=1 Tax=Pollicipes pollicipes TaxID=41117 RepID=UPI0018855373|nr:cyclic AMP-responsive element-binding protein 3-like protein 3 [Pollicipes pollicipes]